MFFVVQSNDSFNFPLGLIQYIVIKEELCLKMNGTAWAVCKAENVGKDVESLKHPEI